MSTQTIKVGSIVYDAEGREGEYIGELTEGGYAVYPLMTAYEGDEEETIRGKPAIWPSPIYTQPPVDKINDEVAKAQEKLNGINAKYYEALRDAKAKEDEYKNLLERLKKHKALEHIDVILENGITHYAMLRYGYVSIVELGNTKSEYGPSWQERKVFGNEFKLLSLFGQSGGDLEWRINEYRDGSGGWTKVVPCLSYEHAQEEAVKLIVEYVTEWRDKIPTSSNKKHSEDYMKKCSSSLCAQAVKLGVYDRLPAWIRINAKEHENSEKAGQLNTLKAAMEKAQAEYEKARNDYESDSSVTRG